MTSTSPIFVKNGRIDVFRPTQIARRIKRSHLILIPQLADYSVEFVVDGRRVGAEPTMVSRLQKGLVAKTGRRQTISVRQKRREGK
jgi:hypothetical protein